MPDRKYDGDPLDMSWQDIKDRPYKGDGETVWASEPETGSETSKGAVWWNKCEICRSISNNLIHQTSKSSGGPVGYVCQGCWGELVRFTSGCEVCGRDTSGVSPGCHETLQRYTGGEVYTVFICRPCGTAFVNNYHGSEDGLLRQYLHKIRHPVVD